MKSMRMCHSLPWQVVAPAVTETEAIFLTERDLLHGQEKTPYGGGGKYASLWTLKQLDHSELLLFCLQYNAHVGESSGPSPCIHRDSHKPTDPERRSTLSKMTCTVQLTEHLLKTLPIDAHSCSIPILLLGPQPRGWGFFVLFCFLLFDNQ